ncbi:hypothetical protein GQS52_03585 [Streptomyces sp. SCUT-3]|uniref:hypothetical protein n=1 Tax=Streptomyces sp. SCUT-3 TaxID=2684469 RepID=UPI0015F8FC01|nr:hypothetical protein [Streptomyces sp. SCUT-3]QMV21015.1 hypothetical protein GQS52_03585 [Streptomyces sp. SCUT-3]
MAQPDAAVGQFAGLRAGHCAAPQDEERGGRRRDGRHPQAQQRSGTGAGVQEGGERGGADQQHQRGGEDGEADEEAAQPGAGQDGA